MSADNSREARVRRAAEKLARRLELAPIEEKVPHLGVVGVQRFANAEQLREDPLDHSTVGEYSIGASFLRAGGVGKFSAKFSFVVRRGPTDYGTYPVEGNEVEVLWRFTVRAMGEVSNSAINAEVTVEVVPLDWDEESQSYVEGVSQTFSRNFSSTEPTLNVRFLRGFPELENFLSFPDPTSEAEYRVVQLVNTLAGYAEPSAPMYFKGGEVTRPPRLDFELLVEKQGEIFTVLLRNYGVSFEGTTLVDRNRRATGTFRAVNFNPPNDRSYTWAVGPFMEAKCVVKAWGVSEGAISSRYWPKNEIVGIGGFYTVEREGEWFTVEVTAGAVVREERESEFEDADEELRESLEELARRFETLAEDVNTFRAYSNCVVEAICRAYAGKVKRLRKFQKEAADYFARLLSYSGTKSLDGTPRSLVLRASTAAGKTLAFLIPTLFAICVRRSANLRGATAMFVYPTRALAVDQAKTLVKVLWELNDLLETEGLEKFRIGILAGESPSIGIRAEQTEVGYRFRHPTLDRPVRITVESSDDATSYVQHFSFDDGDFEPLPQEDAKAFEEIVSVVRDEIYARPPDILITTPDTLNLRMMDLPESHSLFGREVKICQNCETVYARLSKRKCEVCGAKLPNETTKYAPPDVVVVDEAHQLRGSFGGQVSYVFSRFERLVREYLRRSWAGKILGYAPLYVLSSATFVNPLNRVRDFFLRIADRQWGFHGEFEEVVPRTTGSSRVTRVHLFVKPKTYSDTATLARLLERLREVWEEEGLSEDGRPPRTIVFVNSIPENNLLTYTLNDRLGGTGWRIRGHSTDYSVARGRIEEEFSRGDVDLLVATSGLEVGVDFDEVDVVVVHGAPSYLADYRQRVGRAGRRETKRPALVIHVYREKPVDYLYRRYFEVVYDPEKVEEALRAEDAPLPVDNEVVRRRAFERGLFDYLASRDDFHHLYGDALSTRRTGQWSKRVRVSPSPSTSGEILDPYVYEGGRISRPLLDYLVEAAGRHRTPSPDDYSLAERAVTDILRELADVGDFSIPELTRNDYVVFNALSSLRHSDEQVSVRSSTPILQASRNRDLGIFMTRYYDGSIYSYMGVNLVVDGVEVESARRTIPLRQDPDVTPTRPTIRREFGENGERVLRSFSTKYGSTSGEVEEEVSESD